MTKIVAVFAAALVAAVGAYSGTASRTAQSVTPKGAVFTALLTSVSEENGMVVVMKQIRDRRDRIVGWGNTVCVNLPNGSNQCMGTFSLPEGKISVAGTRKDRSYYVFAITGGTGEYEGWGGTLISKTILTESNRTTQFREKLVFHGLAP